MNQPDDVPTPSEAQALTQRFHAHEFGIAIRNGLKLGGSLALTWTVALIVKLQIPAHLGPELQGQFGFAEGFAMMFFSVAHLGVDTYVIKEVSVRPGHASDFVGGVFALRLLLGALLMGAMILTLALTGRSQEVQLTACVFGVGQLCLCLNSTLASVLQAVSKVGSLATANVIAKIIWGAGLLLGLHYRAPMWLLAAPLALSEALKTIALAIAAQSAADLRYRIDIPAVRVALVASLPFFANAMAVVFGNNLAISSLEYIRTDEREVGWFAASQNIGSLAMLLHPLLVWVVTPMLSRAKARSLDDMIVILRRSIQGLLVTIAPVTVFISSGADLFIDAAFGVRYAPAATGLSIIALVFLMTYLNIMIATGLVLVDKSWSVTWVSMLSVVILAVLMLVCVPAGGHLLGTGGECAGAATAVILSEAIVNAMMIRACPFSVFDATNRAVLLKSVAVSLVVLGINRALHGLGGWRLVIDMLVYVALGLAIGIVRVRDLLAVVQLIRERRAARG